jgi:hypothetical protein
MTSNYVDNLKIALKALKGSYKKTKEITESQVVRWRRATGRYFSIIPFEQQRYRMLPGKLLDEDTKIRSDCCEFGFDNLDRLCLIRVVDENRKVQIEQFIKYELDSAWISCYLNAGKSIGKIVELTFLDGFLKASKTLGVEGDRINENYIYTDGRLSIIHVELFHSMMKKTFSHSYECTYSEAGQIQVFRVEADGVRSVAFRVDAPI